jgi:RimJ/RimL family protein N-acetyltransferase
MIVHDSYQNKKLGQALLRAILNLAKNVGVKRLIGFCSVENKVAIHIYTKFGFRIEKEFKPEESILGREEGVVRLSISL